LRLSDELSVSGEALIAKDYAFTRGVLNLRSISETLVPDQLASVQLKVLSQKKDLKSLVDIAIEDDLTLEELIIGVIVNPN